MPWPHVYAERKMKWLHLKMNVKPECSSCISSPTSFISLRLHQGNINSMLQGEKRLARKATVPLYLSTMPFPELVGWLVGVSSDQ